MRYSFPKANVRDYSALLARQMVELFRNLKHSISPKMLFLAAAAVVALAFFGRNIKDILLVSALAFAASYSTIYKRTIRVPSAVELVTIGTVVTGAAYGPLVGALFGILTTFASEIISSGIDAFTMFYAAARGISGGVAFFLVNSMSFSVVSMGIVALVVFNVLCQPIYQMSGDVEAKVKGVYYLIVNTLFNLLVFTFFGSILLGFARL